jgi:ketosteroid isomerase-like protein
LNAISLCAAAATGPLAAWRRNLEDWLGSLSEEEIVRVGFDDVSASAHGDMGLLTANITFAAVEKAGEVLRSLQERLTWVLGRKEGRGWAITHQRTSFPVGPADQKAVMHRIKF